MKHICVFASGTGSNAEKIITHFAKSELARVVLVVCDKPDAGVLQIAKDAAVPTMLVDRNDLTSGNELVSTLGEHHIDLIALAGFLRLLPPALIEAFPRGIVNIHPSLLPAYGGKGMYGQHVHSAVIAAGEKRSGITIHYVNEHYDEGQVIFQEQCAVLPGDNARTLAARVLQLEHAHYPEQIEQLLQ